MIFLGRKLQQQPANATTTFNYHNTYSAVDVNVTFMVRAELRRPLRITPVAAIIRQVVAVGSSKTFLAY